MKRLGDVLVAALAGALAAQVMALGTPRPVPAPSTLKDPTTQAQLADLRGALADAQDAIIDWRHFQECTHQRVVAITGNQAPVMWKIHKKGCFE